MHGGQRLGETGAQDAYGVFREGAGVGDRRGQRGTGGVAGRHPRDPGVRVGVEDRGRVRAAHPPRRLHLAAEPGAELLVEREVRVHDLDRDGTAARAAAQVDAAHPAGAEPAEQPVGPHDRGFIDIERPHAPAPPP